MKDNSGHSEGGEVPKLTKEQAIEPMDSARKYAKLLKIDYGLRANQIAQIEADVREAYYQGYELGHKSTGSVAAPKPDPELKDLLNRAYWYMRSNPPDKTKMSYNEWEDILDRAKALLEH